MDIHSLKKGQTYNRQVKILKVSEGQVNAIEIDGVKFYRASKPIVQEKKVDEAEDTVMRDAFFKGGLKSMGTKTKKAGKETGDHLKGVSRKLSED